MALDRRLLLRADEALLAALDRAGPAIVEPGDEPERSRTVRVLLWRALKDIGIFPPTVAADADSEKAAA